MTSTPLSPELAKSRVASVDLLRVVATFAVVCIHLPPFMASNPNLSVWIMLFCRFAVPAFFILSGYFAYHTIYSSKRTGDLLVRYSRRLLVPFVCLSVFYFFWNHLDRNAPAPIPGGGPNAISMSADDHPGGGVLLRILKLLLEGTSPPLWFLPALWMAIVVHILLRRRGGLLFATILGTIFFIIGNVGKGYALSPVGFHHSMTRVGPVFSLLHVTLGMWLQKSQWKLRPLPAAAFLVAAALLQMIEANVVWNVWGIPPIQDYYFTTPLFGVAAVMFALSEPKLRRSFGLERLGRWTMGIYLIHYAFVPYFYRVQPPVAVAPAVWQLAAPILVFALSALVVMLLSRWKPLHMVLR